MYPFSWGRWIYFNNSEKILSNLATNRISTNHPLTVRDYLETNGILQSNSELDIGTKVEGGIPVHTIKVKDNQGEVSNLTWGNLLYIENDKVKSIPQNVAPYLVGPNGFIAEFYKEKGKPLNTKLTESEQQELTDRLLNKEIVMDSHYDLLDLLNSR